MSGKLWRTELFKQRERVRDRDPPTLLPLTSTAPDLSAASPCGRRRELAFATEVNALAEFLALAPAVEPWEQQQSGVCFMAERMRSDGALGFGGLFCDHMRMGKTLTVLFFILRDLQQRLAQGAARFVEPYLIVCPKSLTHVWTSELRRMLPSEPLVVRTVGTGDALDQLLHEEPLAQQRPFDILLTTYPALRVPACQALLAQVPQFRALFCDEAHELRNAETIAHAAILTMRVHAAWYISGTPIHNHVDNLLSALKVARVPEAAFATESALQATMRVVYLRREGGAHLARLSVTWLDFLTRAERDCYRATSKALGEKKLDWRRARELYAINKLRQLCISPALLAKELPPPPPLVWSTRPTESRTAAVLQSTAAHMLTVKALGGNVRAVSADIKASFYANQRAHFPGGDALDKAWRQFRAAVRALKRIMVPPVSTKETYVAQLLAHAEARGEKIVVFCNYCEPLDRLADQCQFRRRAVAQGGRGPTSLQAALVHGKVPQPERDSARTRFLTDAAVGVLLITLQLGGHGHDFTCANHIVLLDPWFNPQLELQGAHRVLGVNQRREIQIHRLALRGTIDAAVVAIADSKVELAARHLPPGERLAAVVERDELWPDSDASGDGNDDPMDTEAAGPDSDEKKEDSADSDSFKNSGESDDGDNSDSDDLL
jgi:SNF2 family DNA or RNA helicase